MIILVGKVTIVILRTTNACESFHSHFNVFIKKYQIFLCGSILRNTKQIQTDIYCKIRSIHTPKKDYRTNKRHRAIDNAIIKLQNGDISRYVITKSKIIIMSNFSFL